MNWWPSSPGWSASPSVISSRIPRHDPRVQAHGSRPEEPPPRHPRWNRFPHEIRRNLNEAEEPIEAEPDSAHRRHHVPLIFFISTTSFIEEPGVQVDKPQAASAKLLEKNSIIFAVTSDGKIAYGGKEIGLGGVRPTVKRLCAKEPLPVVIQGDEKSSFGIMVRVIDEAKLGGARMSAWPPTRARPQGGSMRKGLPILRLAVGPLALRSVRPARNRRDFHGAALHARHRQAGTSSPELRKASATRRTAAGRGRTAAAAEEQRRRGRAASTNHGRCPQQVPLMADLDVAVGGGGFRQASWHPARPARREGGCGLRNLQRRNWERPRPCPAPTPPIPTKCGRPAWRAS